MLSPSSVIVMPRRSSTPRNVDDDGRRMWLDGANLRSASRSVPPASTFTSERRGVLGQQSHGVLRVFSGKEFKSSHGK